MCSLVYAFFYDASTVYVSKGTKQPCNVNQCYIFHIRNVHKLEKRYEHLWEPQ